MLHVIKTQRIASLPLGPLSLRHTLPSYVEGRSLALDEFMDFGFQTFHDTFGSSGSGHMNSVQVGVRVPYEVWS